MSCVGTQHVAVPAPQLCPFGGFIRSAGSMLLDAPEELATQSLSTPSLLHTYTEEKVVNQTLEARLA